MKYEREKVVSAIYSNNSIYQSNLFVEAMPEPLSYDDYLKHITSSPAKPTNLHMMVPEERRSKLSDINKLYVAMDYMYFIYDMLYRAIRDNYVSKSTIDAVRQINQLHQSYNGNNENTIAYSTQTYSGALLGSPGIGKTSTIRRSLDLMPQVIVHSNYKGTTLYQKQILYLCIECPSDCSIKTLATSIIVAIDQAIGSKYFEEMNRNQKLGSASLLAVKVKIACITHRIGIIVIDEIQNAVVTAKKNNQIRPLIKFLVELTNESCVSVCFSGTMLAEQIFDAEDHLKRRTRGYRLLPMKPDITYQKFIKSIWAYQFTLKECVLNEKIANLIYDYSGGVPSYIMKIFLEAQAHAILVGKELIDKEMILYAISIMQINIPQTFKGGASISDFSVNHISEEDVINSEYSQPGSCALKKKGRPVSKREAFDIIDLYKQSPDENEFLVNLTYKNLVEII